MKKNQLSPNVLLAALSRRLEHHSGGEWLLELLSTFYGFFF
jgi:hypothetical protein